MTPSPEIPQGSEARRRLPAAQLPGASFSFVQIGSSSERRELCVEVALKLRGEALLSQDADEAALAAMREIKSDHARLTGRCHVERVWGCGATEYLEKFPRVS